MTTATESAFDSRTANPDGNRIVVGVDGSKSSLQALHWARALARTTAASIEVITAWQVPAGWVEDAWTNEWSPKTIAKKTAQEAVETALDQASDNFSVRTACGAPAELLLEAGKGAAMIIVGSRGHGGFSGLLLGSVSSAVAAHAECPVLVVHGDAAPFFDPSA